MYYKLKTTPEGVLNNSLDFSFLETSCHISSQNLHKKTGIALSKCLFTHEIHSDCIKITSKGHKDSAATFKYVIHRSSLRETRVTGIFATFIYELRPVCWVTCETQRQFSVLCT